MPTLYIISGPNGAGKTTASFTLLPDMLDCKEYVNADEIARGISPFNPEGVAIEAGRIMLERIAELIEDNESFAFETTLSTRSYVNTIKKCRAKGYNITLVFFWLNSPELAHSMAKTKLYAANFCKLTKGVCLDTVANTLASILQRMAFRTSIGFFPSPVFLS